jgi:anti-sigma factor RsiW
METENGDEDVTHGPNHPEQEALQAFAGGELPVADRVVVESHLQSCGGCRADVEEWRQLFSAMAGLPAFEPRLGFADRVMAGVRIPQPWHVQAGEWVRATLPHALPRSSRSRAAAAALLLIPGIVGTLFMVWLFSQPGVTPSGLWVFATDRLAAGAGTAFGMAVHWLLSTDVAARLVEIGGALVDTRGLGGVGALMASLGAAMACSIWILYMNLIRNQSREANHVSI